jgi:hypothetical protein
VTDHRVTTKLDEPRAQVWTHRALIDDLAATRQDCICFAEVGIGSRWLQGGKIPIPDLLTLQRSYTKPAPTIYECKVSKQDFAGDVRTGKWMKYLPLCCRFYFALPEGIVKKTEIPEEAGLIVRGVTEWRVVKAPKFHVPTEWDLVNVQSLLLAGAWTQERARNLRERLVWADNGKIAESAKALGWNIREAIARLRTGEAASAGGHVMNAVAEVLGVSVPELVGMSESSIKLALANKEKTDLALEALSELASAIRWGNTENLAKLLAQFKPRYEITKTKRKNGTAIL